MSTKRNIRQRRQERIKAIQEQVKHESNLYFTQPIHAVEPSFNQNDSELDRRMEQDPELLWKQQQQLWDQKYREEHEKTGWSTFWSPVHFRNKLIISICLFFLLWGAYQIEHPISNGVRKAVDHILTSEIDFKQIEAWYTNNFSGFPSFIPAFEQNTPSEKVDSNTLKTLFSPVERSTITVPFSPRHPGVELSAPAQQDVRNIANGRVLYVGDTDQTGLTVIIQHADGLRTIYGKLAETVWQPNDWVKGGEKLGTIAADLNKDIGTLYFGIKQDNEFVDPTEVIRFQ